MAEECEQFDAEHEESLQLQRRQQQSLSSTLSKGYELRKRIGKGAFGEVYQARHLLTNNFVALKAMDKFQNKAELARVYSEAKHLSYLHHKHIVRLLEVIDSPEHLVLVLEHCTGGELFDHIVQAEYLEEGEARHLFGQIVSAIHYMHLSGYAHRDLKPENILLMDCEEVNMSRSRYCVKLIDFNLCAKPRGSLDTKLQTHCGSPCYAAPEVLKSCQYCGTEIDIWSLGIILFCITVGRLPFPGPSAEDVLDQIFNTQFEIPNNISFSLRSLLTSMLETEPQRRISISEVSCHKWMETDKEFHKQFHSTLKTQPFEILEKENLKMPIVEKLADFLGSTSNEIIDCVSSKSYDYLTSSYLLLDEQLNSGQELFLNKHFKFSPTYSRTAEHLEKALQSHELSKFDPHHCISSSKSSQANTKHSLTPRKSSGGKHKMLAGNGCSPSPLKILKDFKKIVIHSASARLLNKKSLKMQDWPEGINCGKDGSDLTVGPCADQFKSGYHQQPSKLREKSDLGDPKFCEVSYSRPANLFIVANSSMRFEKLVLSLEVLLDELGLVYMRQDSFFLVERLLPLAQSSAVRSRKKGTDDGCDSNSNCTVTSLKFSLEIVLVQNPGSKNKGDTKKTRHDHVGVAGQAQFALKRKRISGDSLLFASTCRMIIKQIGTTHCQ